MRALLLDTRALLLDVVVVDDDDDDDDDDAVGRLVQPQLTYPERTATKRGKMRRVNERRFGLNPPEKKSGLSTDLGFAIIGHLASQKKWLAGQPNELKSDLL